MSLNLEGYIAKINDDVKTTFRKNGKGLEKCRN